MTVPVLASHVLAVLDHLGVDKAVLVAAGWDSQAMIHLAVERPDRVEKLVLQSFSPCPLTKEDWPHGVPLDVVTAIWEEVSAPEEGRAPQEIIGLLTETAAGDAELASWLEEGGWVGPKTAAAYIAATLQSDVRSLLGRIGVPTLVLHSTRDRWVPVEAARFCVEQIPGARLVELDSGDYLPFTHLLDERIAEIEAFVQDAPLPRAQRRLMTVLFTDVVGSTERLAATRDARWSADLDVLDGVVNREVRRHDGLVRKSMGDGHLATFDRPSDAVAAAQALVRALGRMDLPIRAGVHIGEVEVRGHDIAGMTVHVGARVSGKAGAGEVLVTRTVADLLAGSGHSVEPAGEHELKGVPGSWLLYRVLPG